jgi:hypothetical protein
MTVPLHARVTVEFLDHVLYRLIQNNAAKGLSPYTQLVLDLFDYKTELFGYNFVSFQDLLRSTTQVAAKLTLVRQEAELVAKLIPISTGPERRIHIRHFAALYALAEKLLDQVEAMSGGS